MPSYGLLERRWSGGGAAVEHMWSSDELGEGCMTRVWSFSPCCPTRWSEGGIELRGAASQYCRVLWPRNKEQKRERREPADTALNLNLPARDGLAFQK